MNSNLKNNQAFLFLIILNLLLPSFLLAQKINNNLRGVVVDKETQKPLFGANIIILNSDPLIGVVSNEFGKFKLENIPVGRYSLKISYIGYCDLILSDIIISSGKETILNIELVEKIIVGKTVEIKSTTDKTNALNEMSNISSRSFSIEETNKFAGSWGDPSRMASNFAGVTIVSDKRNDIIVRGNSPIGVQWKMDGIIIPNPNHFAISGSSGGAISMINNNLLSNSDFLSGAFAPEYGNATSAIFDLKMRKGNNKKHEFIAQVGVNGFELGAEGPFTKKNEASFLLNYRYSTLSVLNLLGITIIDAIPNFQDLSFKLYFPFKKSNLSVFGIGGISKAVSHATNDSTKWKTTSDQYGYYSGSQMGVIAFNYTQLIGKKSYSKFYISTSANHPNNKNDSTGFDYIVYNLQTFSNIDYNKTLGFLVNTKLNNKNIVNYGSSLSHSITENTVYAYSYFPKKNKQTINDFNGELMFLQTYVQIKHHFNQQISIVGGLHSLNLFYNHKNSFEPRFSIKWNFLNKQHLSGGFGIHSIVLPLPIYHTQIFDSIYGKTMPNKNLDFIKSNQYVIAYDVSWKQYWRGKVEIYFQDLRKVPTSLTKPTQSLINFGTDDNIFVSDIYKNIGKGYNYGIETTLEKFFSKNYYFLFTTSIYNSKYIDGTNIIRNTRYNCKHAINFLAGKDVNFGSNKNNTIGISATTMLIGGQYFTPIDLVSSKTFGRTIFFDSLAYQEKFKDFFKINLRVCYKRNSKKFSQEIAFEVNNILNRKNIEGVVYNAFLQDIKYQYQLERLPIFLYRIVF